MGYKNVGGIQLSKFLQSVNVAALSYTQYGCFLAL